jgi:hypothetical protein
VRESRLKRGYLGASAGRPAFTREFSAVTLRQRVRAKSKRKIKRLRPKEWTERELHRLRVLAKRKVSAGIVAELLGRHVGSVKKKAREIGLILSKDVKSSCNP